MTLPAPPACHPQVAQRLRLLANSSLHCSLPIHCAPAAPRVLPMPLVCSLAPPAACRPLHVGLALAPEAPCVQNPTSGPACSCRSGVFSGRGLSSPDQTLHGTDTCLSLSPCSQHSCTYFTLKENHISDSPFPWRLNVLVLGQQLLTAHQNSALRGISQPVPLLRGPQLCNLYFAIFWFPLSTIRSQINFFPVPQSLASSFPGMCARSVCSLCLNLSQIFPGLISSSPLQLALLTSLVGMVLII